ncbi:response regulator [Croceitalea sp. MTPC9]|uniref:response regulator n=1 Tax=Croceitalea sp. MTPC9 TaxID=3056568 RepID=UPI0030DC2390
MKQADCDEQVVSMQNGYNALDYLTKMKDDIYPQPDVIFLDINMLAMDGWEFLEEYKKLEEGQKGYIVVVILTTSLNPDDASKAKSIGQVRGFKNKPLSVERYMT